MSRQSKRGTRTFIISLSVAAAMCVIASALLAFYAMSAGRAREAELQAQLEEYAARVQEKEKEVDGSLKRIEELEKQLRDAQEKLSELDKAPAGGKAWETVDFDGEAVEQLRAYVSRTSDEGAAADPLSGEETAADAEVSLYYMDLITGKTIECNADKRRYTASLIKLPYVYSVLKAADEYKAAHGGSAEGTMYDLSRTWCYSSAEMYRDGTGEIKDMPDGTTLTYEELLRYSIVYSDNVAFAAVRNEFGDKPYFSEAKRLGINAEEGGFMQLSAGELGAFMRAVYEFIGEGGEYGEKLCGWLCTSEHGVMIPAALPGVKVAHKYGWDVDAYHDMAIVYGEHPYILVIMTDYDMGGSKADGFIRSIVGRVDSVHREFWESIGNEE